MWGQTPANEAGTNDVSVQALLRRIEELESSQKQMQSRIEQLTGVSPAGVSQPGASSPSAAAAPSDVSAQAAQAAAAAQAAQTAQEASDEEHVTSLGPVKLQGFSDFDFGRPWLEKQPGNGLHGSTNSFNVGDFDLFVNTRISDHWSVLGELLISSDFSNEFGAEMDRLMVTYTANDYLKVSVGKYATAIGYYTNAFHRALFFQTGVSRPLMFADEDNGGVLPVHNIGVTATGKIPSGRWGLHWVAEVANGRSASVPDVPIQNFVDENNGKAVNFALYTRPEWLQGFQAGVSLYRDTLHPLFAPSMGELIPAAYAAYIGSRLEWLNEIAMVRHAVLNDGPVYHSVTSYSQLSWAFGKTRPYFRYDYQNTAATDPILGSLGRENGPSIGVAEHLSRFLILKLQFGRFTEHLETTNTVDGQIALAF